MAIKCKKGIMITFWICIAIFLCLCIFSLCLFLMHNDPQPKEQPQTSAPVEQTQDEEAVPLPVETTFSYNEYIDVKTVSCEQSEYNYPILKGYNDINIVVASKIHDLNQFKVEKAFFNFSYYSVVMRGADSSVFTFNFKVQDGSKLTLEEAAPDLLEQYGQIPFYLDADSITLYTESGEKTVLFSEYNGIRYLPYNPPEYRPAGQEEKVVAITFDDGPHNAEITNKILDKLVEKRAKATFYVLGFECEKEQETLRRIVESGCEIGNHSWHHENLSGLTFEQGLQSLEKTQNVVYEITGVYPKTMRPPYGNERTEVSGELGIFTVEWSVDPMDWKNRNTQQIVEHVKNKTSSGDIVLMHDIYTSSGEAAIELIEYFCNDGWRLVTVSELFDLENKEYTDEILRENRAI